MSDAGKDPTRTGVSRSVSSRIPMAILIAAEARGGNAEALLEAVGLDQESLREENGRVSLHDERRLRHEYTAQLGASLRAEDVLKSVPRGFFGLPEMLFVTAATFGEALRVLIDCIPLVRDGLVVHAVDHGELLEVSYSFETPRPLLSAPMEDYLRALLALMVPCMGRAPSVHPISLPLHALESEPSRAALLERFGYKDILSDSARAYCLFPRSVLEIELCSSAPRLHGVLRVYAAEVLAARDGDARLLSRVRHMLLLEFERGQASIAGVAKRLHISTRSLQRRLAERETSFVKVREALRQTLARQYLRDRERPIAEISYRLGYRSPQAFHRAFQSWFGCAPTAWRARIEQG